MPDFVSGALIKSADVNAWLDDLGSETTNSIAKDGQTAPTANLPMGGFAHTNVAAATTRPQYLTMAQAQDGAPTWRGTAGGTVNAITLTATPGAPAYVAGETHVFLASAANTGAATLAVNGLGTKAVLRGTLPLAAGDIQSGHVVTVAYDGTAFQILSETRGAGWQVLGRQSASLASSLAFALESGFTLFRLTYWSTTVTTGGAQIGLRCGASGTGGSFDSGATDYNMTLMYSQLPSTAAVGNANGNFVDIAGSALSGTNAHRAELLISPGGASSQFLVGGQAYVTGSSPELRVSSLNGGRAVNGAKNAIQVFASTGTISGQFMLEGLI